MNTLQVRHIIAKKLLFVTKNERLDTFSKPIRKWLHFRLIININSLPWYDDPWNGKDSYFSVKYRQILWMTDKKNLRAYILMYISVTTIVNKHVFALILNAMCPPVTITPKTEHSLMVPFRKDFPLAVSSSKTPQINPWVITTHCRLYRNNSQILLLYKTWRYYNKLDYEITGGTLPMCQNTTMQVKGAWIKRYCVSRSKP